MTDTAVVTGIGVICAAGDSTAAFARSLLSSTCSLSEIDAPAAKHFRTRFAGTIPTFDETAAMQRFGLVPPCDRHVLLALTACAQALEESGLGQSLAGVRAAAVFSTCSGSMLSVEKHYGNDPDWLALNEEQRWHASRYFSAVCTAARVFAVHGPALTVTTACSASTNAIGIARDLLASDKADVVLVCGADSFSLTTLAGFDGLKATCTDRCAPFSTPAGMNLGEAGVCVLIEKADKARERNAHVQATVLGYGTSNDAYHCTAPDPTGKGPAAAMTRALENAGLAPDSIAYINAHGTGTEANDKTESRAMRRVFGERLNAVPVSSIKGATGHCLGAAGILETVAGIICAHEGFFPPSVNFTEPRESCLFNHVGCCARAWDSPRVFMTNNLAFGGNNASLIIGCDRSVQAVPKDPDASVDVCIGAVGALTAFGVGEQDFYEGTKEFLASGSRAEIALDSIDLRSIDRRMDLRGADAATRYGAAAASLALAACAIGNRPADRQDIGLMLHCAHAQPWAEAEHIKGLFESGFIINQLGAFPYIVPNSVNGSICKALMLTGHNLTTCFGPGAGLLGLGIAVDAVKQGHASLLLSGATDAPGGDAAIPAGGCCGPYRGAGALMLMVGRREEFRRRGIQPLARVRSWELATNLGTDSEAATPVSALAETVGRSVSASAVGADAAFTVCSPLGIGETQEVLLKSNIKSNLECIDFKGVSKRYSSLSGLLELSWSLLRLRFEKTAPRNYILTFLNSPGGFNCALILEPEPNLE